MPGQLGQQWSVKEEVDDELAIFAGRTRFVSTRRLPESVRASEGGGARPSGFLSQPSSLAEPSVPQQYRPEGSSSAVDHWTPAERDSLHYSGRSAGYASAGVPPPVMPQWRPPRRSHYPYAPQHSFPAPLESAAGQSRPPGAHEHAAVTTSYAWPPPSGSQFGSTEYSGANGYGAQHHPHAFERSSGPANPYPAPPAPPPPPPQAQPQTSQPPQAQTQTQPAAPSELTELGLVSQESRLDERWTSFMRDSGYFEGFGYRGR